MCGLSTLRDSYPLFLDSYPQLCDKFRQKVENLNNKKLALTTIVLPIVHLGILFGNNEIQSIVT